MKLYSAYYTGGNPFHELPGADSGNIERVEHPDQLTEKGILILHGGEDISPSIYNKPTSSYTGASPRLSRRDAIEVSLAKAAIEKGMPIIGICRGAQMLCGLAGGHLIQHVNNHGGRHMVELKGGGMMMTNSIHHQMMYPFNVKHEMRAWITKHLSTIHVDVSENGVEFVNGLEDDRPEPEYVYFPEIKGFAVQWHPEMMSAGSEANKWLLNDIKTELGL